MVAGSSEMKARTARSRAKPATKPKSSRLSCHLPGETRLLHHERAEGETRYGSGRPLRGPEA
jgi:hypothetical protein